MITVRTPLRVTFIGGGSDYPDFFNTHMGCLVGASIDKYVYFQLLPLPKFAEQNFRFTYRTTESVDKYEDFSHPVIRELLISRGSQFPLNMGTMSDIPGNSGLGSSSSFTVAVIRALNEFDNLPTSPESLARKAIWLERERLNEAGGWQDQYQAAFGGLRAYRFSRSSVDVSPPLISSETYDDLKNNFFLVKVGSSRKSSDHAEKTRRLITEDRIRNELLELSNLAQACHDEILRNGSHSQSLIESLSKFTNLGWKIKKNYNPDAVPIEVDELIEYGLKHGASAGRLCGAGGSGFVLFIAPDSRCEELRQALPQNLTVPIRLSKLGAEVLHSSLHTTNWEI